MSKINIIQQKIKELSGGEFQKLCDRYLYKKYNFSNICPLGSEDGTNKPTKGIPDSYVVMPNGKYILIMYGSVKSNSYKKLEQDIKSCLDSKKLKLEKDKIEKIICVYSSTNINPKQQELLKTITEGIPLEIIDLGTMSYDLLEHYPSICYQELNIPIDSHQIFSIDDFVEIYNKKSSSSPLDTAFMFREKELSELKESMSKTYATVVLGASGIGKTRLVLETCKLFNGQEYKVFCIKSNGASIQSDLNMYFNESGNYLLFLDDINEIKEIEYILSFIHTRNEDIKIKIVATVRDYAKERILIALSKYSEPSIISLKKFSDEQIKEFLQKNYNIKSTKCIEQINKISQGNIRLAVMSAQKAINEGYKAIVDVNQLFKYYYCSILNDLKADRDIYCILFIIGFLGATNYKLNEITKLLLNYFNIDEKKFIEICNHLYTLEIIDKYEDQVLKISDQNFRDFILYYVLIEQKYISVKDLLLLTLPKHVSQVVNVLNTILSIFFNKETIDYITTEVNKVWENSDKNTEYYFVKYFSALNLDKTLLYIQNIIKNIKSVPYDIKDYNISENSNNRTITFFPIEVLSKFKRTKYSADAIELLLDIMNKSPEYIHDVYITLSEAFLYDDDSYNDDYNSEYLLIDKIWQLSKQGSKLNETLLLISIFKNLLQIEYDTTKSASKGRSIIIRQMCIAPTENAFKIRKYIWEISYKLYKTKIYKSYIEKLISNYFVSGPRNKYRTKFIQYDMSCFSKLFLSKRKIIDFNMAVILYNLVKIYDYMDVKPNEALLRYKENKEFMFLVNLLKRHKQNEKPQITEQKRKNRLSKQINQYNKQDWIDFFNAFKKYEKCSFLSSESIYDGFMDIFEQLEKNLTQFLIVMNLYFKKRIRTVYYPNKIIRNLFKFYGVKETKSLIKQCRKDEKDLWLKSFYEEYPQDQINKSICKKLIKFMDNTLQSNKPQIIPVFSIEKYRKCDTNIIRTTSQMICKNMYDNNSIVIEFLKNYFFEEDAKKLVNIYSENITILEELYLLYIKINGDHSGCLFVEIFKKDADFWNKFTQKIGEDKYKDLYYHGIFEHIWENEKFADYIDIAIDNMILKRDYIIHSEFLLEKIFPKPNGNEDCISKRQQKYISDFIKKNAYNIEKLKVIFNVIVYRYEALKNEYILELLQINNNVDVFKSIPIEKMSYSFSGSLVPLIEERIKSLENIKFLLKGTKYIEHRCYLDRLIDIKKEKMKQEKIRDYVEEIYN